MCTYIFVMRTSEKGQIMGVTLKEIADIAGVSRGTVDRALHGRGRVRPEIAQKILQIAEEMGYRPNRMGRALAMARKNIRIGVIVQSCETPFMKMVLDGIAHAKNELHELGAELLVIELESVNVEHFLDAIDQLLEQGVQAMALLPTDDESLRIRINDLIERQNMPIITFNSDIVGTKRMCFVGQDSYRSGQACAGLMALAMRNGGKVFPITGHLTKFASKQRVNGFLDECSAHYPQMHLLPLQTCFDNDEYAYEITLHALQANDDLTGIFTASYGQNGVCQALLDCNRKAEICHITYDLTPANREHLINGNIDIVIGQGAFQQGYRPSILLYNYLLSDTQPENEYLYTDILIKTKYNL